MSVPLMPCIHRLFLCYLFPCAVVTGSDDGGRDRSTSQLHHEYDPAILTCLFLRLHALKSEKETISGGIVHVVCQFGLVQSQLVSHKA